MGFIDFTNGEVLTADQMDLVMRQGIMRFADASARDTALSAVLAEGMMAYLDDTDEVLKYDGTDWIDISGDITGVTAGTALTGGGTSGDVTLDVDESALTIAQSQVTDLVSDLANKQDDVITTQGDLVIGDASGDPVRLPVGAADTVLTSDGTTVSFQDAGGGGWTLLSNTTIPDLSTTIRVTGIDQSFTDLRIFINVFQSFQGTHQFQLYNTGGGSLNMVSVSDNNRYNWQLYNSSGGAFQFNEFQDIETDSFENQYMIHLHNYSDSSYPTGMFGYGYWDDDGGATFVGGNVGGVTRTNEQIGEFEFRTNGTFQSGYILIYGRA